MTFDQLDPHSEAMLGVGKVDQSVLAPMSRIVEDDGARSSQG